MTQNTFQIVFSGVTVPGADREQVKRNLAQLFKVPAERIEPMFSGRRVVVKKGLPQEMAAKYQAALRKAGAVCEVVDAAAAPAARPAATPPQRAPEPAATQAPATAPASPSAAVSTEGPAVFGASEPRAAQPATAPAQGGATAGEPDLAPAGAPIPSLAISRATVKEAPQGFGELEGVMIDQPERMVAADDTPPPDIDTSSLTVAEAGGNLVEPEEVPELQVDISELSMGEPGETLAEPEEVPELEVDTSKISLA